MKTIGERYDELTEQYESLKRITYLTNTTQASVIESLRKENIELHEQHKIIYKNNHDLQEENEKLKEDLLWTLKQFKKDVFMMTPEEMNFIGNKIKDLENKWFQ
jgi:hypothetical protein